MDSLVYSEASPLGTSYRHSHRIATLAVLILGLVGMHLSMDTSGEHMRSLHILGRQAFALPVLLTAFWFRRRVVVLLCAALTLFYAAHVSLQWSGDEMEHFSEISEISLLWLLGLSANVFVERERKALAERAMTGEGAVIALVMAIDARERDTRLHSLRVREYAIHLGRAMGFSGKAMEDLSQGALLHDIGKIGIPDAVLLKPGQFDEDEWRIMRRHCEIGAAMIEPVSFLSNARKLVISHHERFDGKGYPRGLSGEEIPLGARIFALIDALDALTSNRPYHKAVTFEDAVLILRKDRGTHFDPRVMDAFDAISLDSWREISDAVQQRYGSSESSPRRSTP